jgi:MFS family permease
VGLLFAASLINYFDRATVSFALPNIAKDLGLSANDKGTLLSAFFWSYALMQIPMGLMADRWNLRWVYAGAFVLWSIAQALTGFAHTLATLVFFRVLLGIGEAIYLPGGTRIVSLLFPVSERGLPCGIFDFGTRSGMVLEGLIVPFMITHYGWRTTFAVIGFTALLWLVPWMTATPKVMRCPRPEQPAQKAGDLWREVVALLRNRDLIGVCIGFFCFDYYWYLLVTWLPDYMVNVRKLTLQWAGIYTALPFMVFGVSQALGGWLGDRLVRAGWNETLTRKGIVSLAFTSGLLLIPAAQAGSANLALAFIMGGCLVGFSNANQLVILQSCAAPAQIGLWVGIFNFVGNLAGIAAPKLTGFLIERTGSYTPAFVLAAVIIALGQFSYWFIVRKLPRH